MRAAGDILDVCSDFMSRVRCAVHIMPCAATQLTNVARRIVPASMSRTSCRTLHPVPTPQATTGIVELWRPLWGLPRPQLLSLLWRHSISPLISCVHLPKFTPGASQPEPHHCLVQSDTDGAACHGSAATTGGVSADSAALTGQQACHGNAAAAQDARPGLNPVQDVLGHVLSAEFHAKVLQGACQELGIDECGEHGEFHTQVGACPRLGQDATVGFAQYPTTAAAPLPLLLHRLYLRPCSKAAACS